MNLTSEQMKEFEEASKPLIKFLCDNFSPYVTVVVTPISSELLSSSAILNCSEFVKD